MQGQLIVCSKIIWINAWLVDIRNNEKQMKCLKDCYILVFIHIILYFILLTNLFINGGREILNNDNITTIWWEQIFLQK